MYGFFLLLKTTASSELLAIGQNYSLTQICAIFVFVSNIKHKAIFFGED